MSFKKRATENWENSLKMLWMANPLKDSDLNYGSFNSKNQKSVQPVFSAYRL